MSHCGISQILFSETYMVPAEQTSQTNVRRASTRQELRGPISKCDGERLPVRST